MKMCHITVPCATEFSTRNDHVRHYIGFAPNTCYKLTEKINY